jgi:hypothetical protein
MPPLHRRRVLRCYVHTFRRTPKPGVPRITCVHWYERAGPGPRCKALHVCLTYSCLPARVHFRLLGFGTEPTEPRNNNTCPRSSKYANQKLCGVGLVIPPGQYENDLPTVLICNGD